MRDPCWTLRGLEQSRRAAMSEADDLRCAYQQEHDRREKAEAERDAAREYLGRDLQEARERILTLELEVQRLKRGEVQP